MKRMFLIFNVTILYIGSIYSTNSVETILREIENNNKALKVARQSADVQKIEAKTGIYPNGISLEYEKVFGNDASAYARESEFTVAQSFDFPTAYIQKNKIAGMRSEKADKEYETARREILLQAKTVCIELVYYNKLKVILSKRLHNAENLGELYAKRLELGDATILEANKIALELANVRNETRMTDLEISLRQQKLVELNGGEPLNFTDTVYVRKEFDFTYEDLLERYWAVNPEMVVLEKDREIASKSIGLARSLAFPKFTVGYKRNVTGPEKYNGFVAGMSIPLWENKNMVRKAKADLVLANLEIENVKTEQTSEYSWLYSRTVLLLQAVTDYKRLLSSQNSWEYLDKALNAGQISLLEYLTEINFLYQSTENFMQLEKDYMSAEAELLKFEL